MVKTSTHWCIAGLLLLLVSLTGCFEKNQNTYSRDELAQCVIDVCKKEYDIDLTSKIIGNTLYVYLPVKDIILSARFLSEKSMKQINNVTLAASRAGLSATNDIQFYKIVVFDTKNPGVELVITRYVHDIKKFMLGAISRDDYIQRMEMDIEFNPVIMGENMVRSFFQKMRSAPANEIIKSFFPDNISIDKVSPAFFAMLMEHSMKTEKKYEIIDIKTKRLSRFKALVYIKVTETYQPDEHYKDYAFQVPSGYQNEYLFVINTHLTPKIMETIYALHKKIPDQGLTYQGFPKEYKEHENIHSWNNSQQTFKDESVPMFVIRQVTNRIRTTFAQDKKLKKLFTTKFVTGQYLKQKDGTSIIQFNINIDRNQSPEALALLDSYYIKILDKSLDIITTLIQSFEFQNFDKIYVHYVPQKKKIILDTQLMERFHKHNVSIPELIKMSELVHTSLS